MERRNRNSGYSLLELVLAISMMTIVVGLSVSAFIELFSVNSRTNGTSYATSLARSGIDAAAVALRNDLVQFNTVSGTPLGINFDLDDLHGPVVRDGLLFYVDTNHTARIYSDRLNPQFTAGMDDLDGDGHADVFGLGLVRQSTRAADIQDDIDLNHDGMPDDLDGDGNPDPLWTLRLVKFKSIADVSNVTLWLGGYVLARDLYIRRINPAGPLAAANIDTFRFTGNNPNALLMDANQRTRG
jgi:type II secretory pathway pseudopilin PulG